MSWLAWRNTSTGLQIAKSAPVNCYSNWSAKLGHRQHPAFVAEWDHQLSREEARHPVGFARACKIATVDNEVAARTSRSQFGHNANHVKSGTPAEVEPGRALDPVCCCRGRYNGALSAIAHDELVRQRSWQSLFRPDQEQRAAFEGRIELQMRLSSLFGRLCRCCR